MTDAVLRLNPKADRRLRGGHLWVYSNEVDTRKTPLKQYQPGQVVRVENAQGKALGAAMVNPNQLICARLFSRDGKGQLNAKLIRRRLEAALTLRQQVFKKPYYRLVYGDSDSLPGLVVDRFNDTLVVQVSTAGIEQVLDMVVEQLIQLMSPTRLVIKNDGKMRAQEGLESYVQVHLGELEGDGLVYLEENGTRFEAPVLSGQKTGWFYDHRFNRSRAASYCQGKRVLDVCSYVGGWGIQAATAGAKEVVCLDTSEKALGWVGHNALLNQVEDRVQTLHGDAFNAMKSLVEAKEKFDVVIIDPPAFIPKRKDMKEGELAYSRLNQLALRLMSNTGVLVSASCSMHLGRDRLTDLVRASGRKIDRQVQILEQGWQAPDHPVHPSIPETEYIKSLIALVSKTEF